MNGSEDMDRTRDGLGEWLSQAPKVADALKKGTSVSVTTWGGQDIAGLVCDREETGILLDTRETGYYFVPWGSIQHVHVEEVARRRVKFLPS